MSQRCSASAHIILLMKTKHMPLLAAALCSGLSLFCTPAVACELPLKLERQRELASWKPQIAAYSQRHYAENTWELKPSVIVLHYTVSKGFPWNLVNTADFAGETPGLAVHYVVEGSAIWQLLPPNVRSRGAYGINHRAINIEMVAMDAADLARKPETLQAAARLTACLMQTYQIPLSKVYSHEQVSKMDSELTPEVLDRVDGRPYHKIDPGEGNMQTLKHLIEKALNHENP